MAHLMNNFIMKQSI